MIDRSAIKREILSHKGTAAEYAQKIVAHGYKNHDGFSELFRCYLKGKFILEDADLVSDDFYQICQRSVERATQFPPGAIDASEFASRCGGATTATNKKIFFMMALRQELGVPLTDEEAVATDTLSGLISLCYRKLEEKP